jgi:hypothetical protein
MGLLKIIFLLSFIHLKINTKKKLIIIKPLLYVLLKKTSKKRRNKWIKIIRK